MREETFFEMGSRDMWVSELIMSNLTGDEIEINIAAYHVHQALLNVIKFQLEMQGVRYRPQGNVRTLTLLCQQVFSSIPNELLEDLDIIVSWEDKTRYSKTFFVPLHIINRILPKVKSYMSTVKDSYQDMTIGTRTTD